MRRPKLFQLATYRPESKLIVIVSLRCDIAGPRIVELV